MKSQLLRNTLAHLASLLVLGTITLTVHAQPPAPQGVHVGVRPPPPRVERVPVARPGHVWAGGYWGWNGGAHVWYPGQWVPERPGFRYYGPNWAFVGGEWVFTSAYWAPMVVEPAPVVVVQQAPVVVQQQPTEYIQQPQVAPPQGLDPNYWYYCQNPAGYYPYVQNCDSWQQVTPTPPQQ